MGLVTSFLLLAALRKWWHCPRVELIAWCIQWGMIGACLSYSISSWFDVHHRRDEGFQESHDSQFSPGTSQRIMQCEQPFFVARCAGLAPKEMRPYIFRIHLYSDIYIVRRMQFCR